MAQFTYHPRIKKLSLIFGGVFSCLTSPVGAWAQTPVAPPAVYPADTWQGKDVAVIRVLDRIKSDVQTIALRRNQTQHFGTLDLTMRRCLRRAPTLPTDDAAWLEIRDNKIKTSSFDGWMIHSMPQIGVFENPVFDVRLVRCEGADSDPLLPKLERPVAPAPLPRAATKNSGGLDNLRIQPETTSPSIVQQPLSAVDIPPDENDEPAPSSQAPASSPNGQAGKHP